MKDLFSEYQPSAAVTVKDGVIGIPVRISVLFDYKNRKAEPGYRKTPIIVYVINTATERVGTESDEKIISGMLSRGFAVAVLDYMGSALAVCPALDFSVQELRARISTGEFFDDKSIFPCGLYSETIVVPSGCDLLYNSAFWSFDKHGADGDLEKIVEVWNNDFRGTRGETLVKWVDTRGRKKTVAGLDTSSPVWYDECGNECETGEYIRVKHTLAETITDIVKPDGEPVTLDLYMHVVYPTSPKKKVAVMCLSSSHEDLCSGAAIASRPHLNGFLFRGYAAAMFDYGYVPMARLDAFGYFDGFPMAGHISGDNQTYSLWAYNDKRITTAALRFIRYLALSDGRFAFDTEKIGVFGNSKGSWITFLGEDEPEKMTSRRMYAGHHGETRYENGKTKSDGIIRGGEEQPWLSYNGKKIESRANLVYSSCGSNPDAITEGHAPTFISFNRLDASCYSIIGALANACKVHDVPTLCLDTPLGHTVVTGKDLVYGVDAYSAFFDFSGYYLYDERARVIGVRYIDCDTDGKIKLLFSGATDEREVQKISVTDDGGVALHGTWHGSFGGVEWTFTPSGIEYGKCYTLYVNNDIIAKNGRNIKADFEYKFRTPDATVTKTETLAGDYKRISLVKECECEEHFLALCVKCGTGRVGVYTNDGVRVGSAGVSGAGRYRADISDYLRSLPLGARAELTLRCESEDESKVIFSDALSESSGNVEISPSALCSRREAPGGVPALKIDGFKTVTDYPSEEFYSYPATVLTAKSVLSDTDLTKLDDGRKFKITLDVYDTAERYLKLELDNLSSREKSYIDLNRCIYNAKTVAGEWKTIEIYHTFSLPPFCESVPNTKLTLSAYGHGSDKRPLYLANLTVTEMLAPVEIGKVQLISRAKTTQLPEGVSEIHCPKSKWAK